MAFTNRTTEHLELKLVTPQSFDKLLAHLHADRNYADAGWDEPPEAEKLRARLFTRKTFIAYEVYAKGSAEPLGYAGIVSYATPYLWFDVLRPAFGPNQIFEAGAELTHAYFAHSRKRILAVHVPIELEEELRPLLVDMGFDPTTSIYFDPSRYASFYIKPETFALYFDEPG